MLLIGERGTGKELAARRLHYLSPRWSGPLVTLNCAALAPGLVESELFGHEAGAFTGAAGRRRGRFELADRGTLFLDEIGAMPLPVQEKILRVVEYGEFERVGGSAAIKVDVRVVGATHADLPALARMGRFKRDLLDRLAFAVLTLPPLRARTGDAALLAAISPRAWPWSWAWPPPRTSDPRPWTSSPTILAGQRARAQERGGARRALERRPHRRTPGPGPLCLALAARTRGAAGPDASPASAAPTAAPASSLPLPCPRP